MSHDGVLDFFARPLAYLTEIISSLSSDEFATLGLLFVRGGHLRSPLRLTDSDVEIIRRLGGRPQETALSLQSTRNVFTRLMSTEERRQWEFRHPTIRDAMRAVIKSNDELLDIYISGTHTDQLFSEVVCGNTETIGEAVTIPADQYDLIFDRLVISLAEPPEKQRECYLFMATRCSDRFLRDFLQLHPSFANDHLSETIDIADPRASLVLSLYSAGILRDHIRASFVTESIEHAIEWVRSDIVADRFRPIITPLEWRRFVDRVYGEVLMGARDHTEWISENAPADPQSN